MTISGIRLTPLYAAALALALPASAMAAGEPSKDHHCGDRKMEIFQPKDGTMELRAEGLTVRIWVAEDSAVYRARYLLSANGVPSPWTAGDADKAISTACKLVARFYGNQKAPSAEELRKQLSEFYDDL